MGGRRPARPLGGAFLGLTMSGAVLVAALAGSNTRPCPEFPSPSSLSSPRSAALLGWPMARDEPDPAVWATLPGVGPVRASRLAELAVAGKLRSPADLLQVRGIGIKMAARIAPWIRWPAAKDGPTGTELGAQTTVQSGVSK